MNKCIVRTLITTLLLSLGMLWAQQDPNSSQQPAGSSSASTPDKTTLPDNTKNNQPTLTFRYTSAGHSTGYILDAAGTVKRRLTSRRTTSPIANWRGTSGGRWSRTNRFLLMRTISRSSCRMEW